MRIGDVLRAKSSHEVLTISPDAGVRELLASLAEHNIGALIVSRDGGTTVAGIVSERDVVRHLHHDGTVINNTVGAIMTEVVETCEEDTVVDELMKIMTERRIRHVPVVKDGNLVGIISIGDVVKTHVDALETEREQLVDYIRTGR